MEPRDVFISYIEEDGSTAQALAKELRARGRTTWTYQQDGNVGRSHLAQTSEAIEVCDAFVLIASEPSLHAPEVIREVEHAHRLRKVIIPVRVGLTHDQFMKANRIVAMAVGTGVSILAESHDLREVARRIVASLKPAAVSPPLPSVEGEPHPIKVVAALGGRQYLVPLIEAMNAAVKRRQQTELRLRGLKVEASVSVEGSMFSTATIHVFCPGTAPVTRLKEDRAFSEKLSKGMTDSGLLPPSSKRLDVYMFDDRKVWCIKAPDSKPPIDMRGEWTIAAAADILITHIMANTTDV